MNRKKGIRILLTVLTVAALLAAGGYALWKNGFFEKINSVEALREVIAGTGMWAGGVYFALQMMTVIIAPIPSNISMMAGALALGFWPAMILGVLAVGVGSVIVFLAARALGKKAVQRFLDKGVMDKYLPIIEEKQDMFHIEMFLELLVVKDVVVILCGGLTQRLGRGRGEHLFEVRGRRVGPAGAVFGNEQAHDEHGSRGGGRQAVSADGPGR